MEVRGRPKFTDSLDRVRHGKDGKTCGLLLGFRACGVARGAATLGERSLSPLEVKRGEHNWGDALCFTSCNRGCQYPTPISLALILPAHNVNIKFSGCRNAQPFTQLGGCLKSLCATSSPQPLMVGYG
jgi:hypothetical protein